MATSPVLVPVALASALAASLLAAPARAERPVEVYLLAGQSNLVGYGDGTALPPALRSQPDVWFDHYNAIARTDATWAPSTTKDWVPLGPMGPDSLYGPEITFGRAMADARPNERIAIVKVGLGGTNIFQHWGRGLPPDPTYLWKSQLYHTTFGALDSATYSKAKGNALEYPDEPTRLDHALARLKDAGLEMVVAGLVWMQGENEANWSPAYDYDHTLPAFLAAVRQDLGAPALPIALGRISSNLYAKNGGPISSAAQIDAVRAAQEAVVAADPHARIIDTDDLPPKPGDAWHFSSAGYQTMGSRFAAAMLTMLPAEGGSPDAGAGGAPGTKDAGGGGSGGATPPAGGGAGSGGAPGSASAGGANASGGASASATGGANVTGGKSASGGANASGGAGATGGTSAPSTASGAGGAGTSAEATPASSGGCALGGSGRGDTALGALAAIAVMALRRGRR
jgi:hypothetical protein